MSMLKSNKLKKLTSYPYWISSVLQEVCQEK